MTRSKPSRPGERICPQAAIGHFTRGCILIEVYGKSVEAGVVCEFDSCIAELRLHVFVAFLVEADGLRVRRYGLRCLQSDNDFFVKGVSVPYLGGRTCYNIPAGLPVVHYGYVIYFFLDIPGCARVAVHVIPPRYIRSEFYIVVRGVIAINSGLAVLKQCQVF